MTAVASLLCSMTATASPSRSQVQDPLPLAQVQLLVVLAVLAVGWHMMPRKRSARTFPAVARVLTVNRAPPFARRNTLFVASFCVLKGWCLMCLF